VSEAARTERIVKALLAVALVAVVVWFFASGTYRTFEARTLSAQIDALHGAGPFVFVLAFAVVQPLGPSGHIFILCASLVWPPPVAFALSMVGAVLSQVTGFLFYRYVAADFARARIPKRLLQYEERLVASPFRTVLVLRLVTFTWPLVSMLLGVSRIRFAPMLGATVLGLVPGVAFDIYLAVPFFRFVRGLFA
jgi:uncharacterized membrane protein YdjX (TVP38/TMEM64 family)